MNPCMLPGALFFAVTLLWPVIATRAQETKGPPKLLSSSTSAGCRL